ncbi:hypothetical protein BJX70DRAFT_410391 [Aspergillus crustosus]
MHLSAVVAASLGPAVALALSRRAVECHFSTTAAASNTCASFASSWGLTISTLQQLNPGITCPNLDTSQSYCVIGTVTEDPEEPGTTLTTTTCSTTTTTTTTMTTTTTTSSAPSNSPTMPGIAENCDAFYLISITVDQLKSWNSEINDNCSNLWLGYYICVHVPGATTTSAAPEPIITSAYSISVNQLRSWNSEINADCSNLWLGYYICVHVPGATTIQPANPEPTEDPSDPTPQMPGIVENCQLFHLIESGDSCWSIYTEAGITLEQFLEWNTQVDAACSNLWLGYYVCVGV